MNSDNTKEAKTARSVRDNHGAGPCAHCSGSGQLFDARIGDVECHECDGAGHFDESGEPVKGRPTIDEANTTLAVARTRQEKLAACEALAAAALAEAQRLRAIGSQP